MKLTDCSLSKVIDLFEANKLLFFFVPFVIFMSNGREISSGDTAPTVFTAVNLAAHGTIYLDNLHDYIAYKNLPYYVSRQHGHILSNYPIFPGIMAFPIFAPFVWIGMINPGDGDLVWRYLSAMSGACFTSIAMIFMYFTLKMLTSRDGAFILAAAYGFGTALWPIAAKSLWQHGPSVLWWSITLFAIVKADLVARKESQERNLILLLILAGTAAGCAFLCRNVNLIGIIFIGLAVLWRFRFKSIYYCIPAILLSAMLLTYNYGFFGNWNGGYEELLKLQWQLDRIETGRWATPLSVGLAGQLICPSRGILIFSPFLIFAFVGMIQILRTNNATWRMLAWTIPIPILMLLLFAKYSVWWGGNAHYGPRYQIETYPFLILFIAALWESIQKSKIWRTLFFIMLIYAIFVQWVGAFCYPSDWASFPVPISEDKSRLWDWANNQIYSCLKSGIKPFFQ